jgi:Histidine kinase-, DNA gyrase B-, and HSP90-like ATPase
MARRIRQLPDGSTAGQIGVQDPFELIRHLARSQSDPRKAVAELVQNALDEQASHIAIERFRNAGEPVLSILDDGTGVIPELPRREALTTIAASIGHSRKRQLTFDERMRAAMLGQYGIGLLGFWALGHELRMVSRVAESEVWALTLFEDSPRYTVTRVPDVIGRGSTWTEVQIRRLHRAALGPTAGGRLANYLSAELRGQLIRHGTEVRLVDRLGRASGEREVVIRPDHLAGEPLPGLEPIRLPDFKYPIDVTLHYAGDAGPDSGRVRLACAGAVVLDDVTELPELSHSPWSDTRLVGVVDFPHLEVPPGSRRGIVPNEAAAALVQALLGLEGLVSQRLEERSRAEASALSEDLHKQLARLFTRISTFVPHLEWFPVTKRPGALDGAETGTLVPPSAPPSGENQADDSEPGLLPVGPLSFVSVRPTKVELAVGERRELRARANDEEGRALSEEVGFQWAFSGPLALLSDNASATIEGLSPADGALVEVTARQGNRVCSTSVPVRIVNELQRRIDAGVPQPEEVDEPLQGWRSRLVDARWQINVGHPDYRALSQEARPRLRYLATLLSKEVVSRNFPQPGVGAVLEELVGLLAALERSGAWSGRPREG